MADFINTIELLGDDAVIDSLIERNIVEFRDNIITNIPQYAFAGCKNLHTVDLPSVNYRVDNQAFSNCSSLVNVSLPLVQSLYGGYSFESCTSLEELHLPELKNYAGYTFSGCTKLKKIHAPKVVVMGMYAFQYTSVEIIDFPNITSIPNASFARAQALRAVTVRSTTMITIASTNAFDDTPIANGTGYIYVPRALIEDYKAATNWSVYADQFLALEDYTADGTITGELLTECDSISLNVSELNLTDTTPYTLIATTIPNRFINKHISWMTSNPFVATVHDGVITAVSDGIATITATCGEHSTTCTISVSGVGANMPPAWYSLPQETTFNGTSDYIDTGIKLFDNSKSFTIICDATFDQLAASRCLFHCMNEASGYPGISVDGKNGVRISYTTGNLNLGAVSTVKSLGIRYVNGLLDRVMYKNVSGDIITATISGTPKYTAISQNLLLGAYQNTAGKKGRYFQGTIYAFDVFDFAVSDDDIAHMLSMR